MKKKKAWARAAAVLIATAMTATGLLGCGKENNSSETNKKNSSSEENGTNVRIGAFDLEVKFKDEDLDDSWKESEAINIALSDGEIQVSGSGASATGSKLTITKAGTYVLSGSLSDGQIFVEADDEDLVRLVFNGIDISCSDSAPVYIANADKTVIILAKGSENTITDGANYTVNADEEPNAAVFSKDDLTINGTGKLTVTANYNNGIGCKDDLKLVSGQITVKAVNHGIRGNDSVAVRDGSYTVTAGGQGVKTSNETDDDKGYIYVEGGTFTIDSTDDGLHSNAAIGIFGGTFTIASGDDAIHSDNSLTITEGTIDITSSYEGLESAEIYISGGDISIVASDDGINAAGGELDSSQSTDRMPDQDMRGIPENMSQAPDQNRSDMPKNMGQAPDQNMGEMPENMGQMPDQNMENRGNMGGGKGGRGGMGGGMMESSTGYLSISGGSIYVDAGGDGLDSNGDVEMSGGYVVVNGPTNDGNGSLDYGSSFIVTGGTLIATGSSGMAVAPSNGTTVNTAFVNFNSAAAGSTLKILDSKGEEVLNTVPTKTYSSLVYSSDSLKSQETYTVTVDGETVAEFIMNDTVTKTGNASGGMGGGMGGRGDMNGGRDMDGGRMGGKFNGNMENGDGTMTPPSGNEQRGNRGNGNNADNTL